ncbi:hypothetical protein [Rubrivirga sp. IMCC45206]|uniref:hypothetical protein n=1 Tax=Rubrivirga sp. IMCC45206 TaxID=3391614 RepID=UPI00398FE3C7
MSAACLPTLAGLAAVVEWLPIRIPAALLAIGAVLVYVGIAASLLTIPLALAALTSYRRHAPPVRRRTTWTVIVLALLTLTAVFCGALFYSMASS